MVNINLSLVKSLIFEQFPLWAHLEIKSVEVNGWDNRSFRLGDSLLIRLPNAERYAMNVHKEQKWLPKLAPFITFKIPKPIAWGNHQIIILGIGRFMNGSLEKVPIIFH